MATSKNIPVIAIEEHYYDPQVTQHFTGADAKLGDRLRERLEDVNQLRLREMDEAGIDIQVLSHGAPSTQRMDAATAVPVARAANDHLQAIIQANPDRFAGFAALPTPDPKAAADELERVVTEYGFQGRHGAWADQWRVSR